MTRLPVILLGLVATLFVLFLHAPMAMIVLFSFNDSNVVAFPLSGFTLEWYRSLPEKGPMFEALFATLRLGIPVAIATTLVGFLAAVALTRHRLPGKKALSGLLMVPLAVPTFILGVALLTLVRQVLDIQPSLWVLGLPHMLIALPYAIFTLSARLQGLDASFEEASRDLGRSPAQTFWRITVPLAMPAIVSSLMLSFIISFDEYMLAYFLAGNAITLPLYMMGEMRFSYALPGLLALGSILFVLSVAMVVGAELLRRRGPGGTR